MTKKLIRFLSLLTITISASLLLSKPEKAYAQQSYVEESWEQRPGCARDIGVGESITAWITDCNQGGADPNDLSIQRWTGAAWEWISGGARNIAVEPNGTPWIVNSAGTIFRKNGDLWEQVPGCARDIGVGQNGAAWHIGCDQIDDNGSYIYEWTGSIWQQVDGVANQIAIEPNGTPWVVTQKGDIFRRVGSSWEQLPGCATDIGVGENGSAWVIGCDSNAYGYGIHRWTGSTWERVDGGAVRIAVEPNGTPWVINNAGTIYRRRLGNMLRVMAWNIQEGEAGLDRIAEQIRLQSPDLVLLNEVKKERGGLFGDGVNDVRELSRLTGLPHHHWWHTNNTGLTGWKAVAVLSRYPLGSASGIPAGEGFATLQTSFTVNNISHQVFSTRFPPQNTSDHIIDNAKYIRITANLIRQRYSSSSVIFGGDLNAHLEASQMQYFEAYSSLVNSASQRVDATGVDSPIDYIFYRGSYKVITYQIRSPWAGNSPVSDHGWVLVELLVDDAPWPPVVNPPVVEPPEEDPPVCSKKPDLPQCN